MLLEALLPFVGSMRGRVVIVTGASSGIGRATALAFGRCGANVALLARRRELLDELASEIRSAGGKALALPVDVGEARAVRHAVARALRAWQRIDVLVNNAGVLIPAPVGEMRVGDLQAMMSVNLFGAVHAIQAVVPAMKRRRRGSIVNVASLAGRRGFTALGGYCATKFALVGLSEALRTELRDANIHVGVVMPGAVDTPMVRDVDQAEALPEWPAALNMPPEWVVAAILLAVRFRLHEVSVPPGAATLEIIGSLAPGAADAMIGWMATAGRLLNRAGSLVGGPAASAAPKARARARETKPAARRRRASRAR
jgi:NAD(P)-dependent dehydrogenase (short-subunit alcohol dehydrogenase family)